MSNPMDRFTVIRRVVGEDELMDGISDTTQLWQIEDTQQKADVARALVSRFEKRGERACMLEERRRLRIF